MELRLDPIKVMRDAHGRFVKNHPCSTFSGKPLSKKRKKNISRGLKRAFKEGRVKPPKYEGKTVVMLKDGKFIRAFKSATSAAAYFNVNKVNIIRVCTKKRNSFRGFLFFYDEDPAWLKLIASENERI